MSFRQFRFRLPWQSLKASVHPQNESSRRSSQPADEAAAESVHEIKPEHPPPPSESFQTPESSETMPPSKSHKEPKVHSQPSSRSRAKNQTRTPSKLPSPSVASNKSPSASAKGSPSHDTSKPSSPAGKVFLSHDGSKPSSSAGKASPSHDDTSKPSSPAVKASRSRDTSKPSSTAAAAPRSRFSSKPPSPSQTSSKNHPHSKPTSQSRLKADSQPSSSSRSGFSPRSPSHENSRQRPSKKTSWVQSPSHLSSKPTVQSTSQHPIESPAAIGDQTTNRVVSHPDNQSPQARPRSRESPLLNKSKDSPRKPDLKPLESNESKDQPETKEVLTSKNTSCPQSNQNSSETPIGMNQTIENGQEPSPELQAESKENEDIKSDKEDVAKTTNAFQTNASKSKLITSTETTTPFEQEKNDSRQEGTMEDLTKTFRKLNIKYPDEENTNSFTTLAGDNKGASMHLLSDKAKTESSIHIHRQYKRDPDQSPKKSSTDIQQNFNQETTQDSIIEEDPPLELYINMNVQGINNSILSNSSFSENNPGIKLKFVRKQTKSKDESKSLHARKAKYTAKATEKLTYEAAVRRRCLGGLLMESSDSEVDNPEKPRRHGCRYRRSWEEK